MLWQRSRDVGLACETFGISRATLYRWIKEYDQKDMNSLKEKSRRPRRVRKHQWSWELVQAVKGLRTRYPRWGKDKLIILMKQEGWNTSVSTVGRILTDLKKRGQIIEPERRTISAKRKVKRPYAVRKPKEYHAVNPGDLVEVDTLDIRPLPSIILKQFTARDIVSRWDVLEVCSTASAKTAREFLFAVEKRMPFPVKAIQVDGGSEFFAEFENACKEKDIQLYVLPPKSPKLNGHVERANRTHTEEFYEVYPTSWTVAEINKEPKDWEHVYNRIRPHQSLGYKTPLQFLKDCGILCTYDSSFLSHMQ
jgi:transposase InsO family protein